MNTLRSARIGPALGLLATLLAAACTAAPTENATDREPAPTGQIATVCDDLEQGPTKPPNGAVVVRPGAPHNLSDKTEANPPGTTFWLAPGVHKLGSNEFSQVVPKDGNAYIGAPGAVLDGQGENQYAFTQHAEHVTIKYLTIRHFSAPRNQGVVNHDSGDGWLIAHNTIEENKGAALMAGSHQVVRGNCLRNNGQYAINAYQAGNRITDVLVEGNEIVGNNTDDWETKRPGCGCSGAMKFWSVDGATIRDNWIHDNNGVAIWADTNNNDFLIENNMIEHNNSQAIFYETSYNAIIRNNVIRENTIEQGQEFASDGDDFPVAAIYISESGGESRLTARTDKIEIYGNVLKNNWSGITLWENADRFCNSPANPTSDCTLLVDNRTKCSQPKISSPPLYDDCRWKTQRVDIHDNKFITDPEIIDCAGELCGRMALLANYGTYPEWSPYRREVVQDAIMLRQDNRWHDNTYVGQWSFVAHDRGTALSRAEWQAKPYSQDSGSTFKQE